MSALDWVAATPRTSCPVMVPLNHVLEANCAIVSLVSTACCFYNFKSSVRYCGKFTAHLFSRAPEQKEGGHGSTPCICILAFSEGWEDSFFPKAKSSEKNIPGSSSSFNLVSCCQQGNFMSSQNNEIIFPIRYFNVVF